MKINKTLRLCWMALVCGGLVCSFSGAEEGKKVPLSVGYFCKGITEVDERNASAALTVWTNEIGGHYGFDVKPIMYESLDHLVKDFIDKKVDFVTMPTIDYFRFAPVLKAPPELASLRNNRVSVRYLLLVSDGEQNKGLANLKNKRLAIRKGNSLGMMFMDVELMKATLPPSDRFFAAVKEKNKENQVVLSVFFGQADACIVSDAGYAMMVELNPQVGRKLKVMASSPEMVEIVGFFSNSYPPEYKEKAKAGIIKGVKESKRAEQMRLLFNTEGMDTITDDQLDTARMLFAEYNRFNGENRNQHP